MITQEIISRNKQHYIDFFYKEIVNKAELTLQDYDFEEGERVSYIEVILLIDNVSLDITIYGAKFAYRNNYTFDGELIGRYKKEEDHDYEFTEISISKKYFCEETEEWFDFEIAEEINSKLFELNKL